MLTKARLHHGWGAYAVGLASILLLTAAAAGPALAADPLPDLGLRPVTATGVAPLRAAGVAEARTAAIELACRNAVQQACGMYIASTARVRNFELVSEEILAHASGYVQSYTVTAESPRGSLYHVTIDAQVNVGAIQNYADHSILVADFAGADPQEGKEAADAFSTALAGSSRYVVLERTPVRTAVANVLVSGAGVLSEEECRRVAKQLGARYLVAGSYAVRGSGVTLSARLMDLTTGKVVPSGAATMLGDERNLYYLSAQLANKLHVNLTGLWLRGAEAPAAAGAAPRARVAALQSIDPTRLPSGSAGFAIKFFLDRPEPATYRDHEHMTLRFRAQRDCYLTVYNIDAVGRVILLYPNGYQTDNFVKAGTTHTLPAANARWDLEVEGEPGVESIQAIASTQPLDLCASDAFATSPFPQLSPTAAEFVEKSISPRLAAQEQGNGEWTSAVVKFYHAPAAARPSQLRRAHTSVTSLTRRK